MQLDVAQGFILLKEDGKPTNLLLLPVLSQTHR